MQDAVGNALKRRADDLNRELAQNKLDPVDVTQIPTIRVVVKLKNSERSARFLDLMDKSLPRYRSGYRPKALATVFYS